MKPTWLERFRRWLDEVEGSFEINPPPKPLSAADHFFLTIAREIEATMRREAFTPYGEPPCIPRLYFVFLSAEDNNEWHGEKRRKMEDGLHNAIRERAVQLVGSEHLQSETVTIELRLAATLAKGQVVVQAVWDEVEKTTVLSKDGKFSLDELPTDEVVIDPADAPTVVLQFTLQLQHGAATESRPLFAASATIGRGKDCDLQLTDDTSISRLHATLTKNADQTFTLLAQGKNPLTLSAGQELAAEQEAQLQRGDSFTIGAYELTIQ